MSELKNQIKKFISSKEFSIVIEEIKEFDNYFEVSYYKEIFTDWQTLTKIRINKQDLISFLREESLNSIIK